MKLEIGYNTPIEVRREYCQSGLIVGLKIMYLSDLHLNRCGNKAVDRILEIVECESPDIILLGGDYIDTDRGFPYFIKLLNSISKYENVFAIAGNHDYFFGLNSIKKCFELNHIQWIDKKSVTIQIKNRLIKIDGNLESKIASEKSFNILSLHKPINIEPYKCVYDIAFAGHLHGCQFVLVQSEKGLYPGRFFYKWNILKKEIGKCTYYISKGLGDTLPIRFNCKKEILIVETIKLNK
jgi:predicted MPP superfamily phosphohydrolase